MGAEEFCTKASGHNPKEAFDRAVEQAQWECGHGGYTGTIAEKTEYVMVDCSPNELKRLVNQKIAKIRTDKVGVMNISRSDYRITSLEIILASCHSRMKAEQIAEGLMLIDDRRYTDKWGPCGCIDAGINLDKTDEHTFIFFGRASS